jgi:hypothetical protein
VKRIGSEICGVALLLILISFSASFANGIQIQSDTVIKASQRTGGGENSEKLLLPVYEYLGLDYGDSELGGVSFHLYGWGRKDLAGADYFEDDPDGDLLYGYLEYRKPYGSFNARLGRQHLFAGVTNESMDGLRLGGSLGDQFTLTLFGGVPSAYDDDDANRGELTYGGRVAHHNAANYEVGLSYQRIDGSDGLIEEKAGADLNVQLGSWFSFSGLSSINVTSGQWCEHNYSMSLQWLDFSLEPLYQRFQ